MATARPRHQPGPPLEAEVTIAEIGARGDGVAATAEGRVFVPLTVPGDRLRVRLGPVQAEGRRGQPVAWLERGPAVAEPACRHFGRCGGCTLQHLAEPAYGDWKCAQVAAALARAGLAWSGPIPLARTPPGGRRRAAFAVTRRGPSVQAGFAERLSHRLVDLEACPVLAPDIFALLGPLRRALLRVLPDRGGADVVVTRVDGGLDVLLTGPARLDLTARQVLAELAEAADLARLSWQSDARATPEPVAARRPARVWFGGLAVEAPPGAFLQASREGEVALVQAVVAGVGEGGPVADLFAGCGTFSLPLVAAGGRRVHAVDGNGPAVAALARAGRGVATLTTEVRDLGRQPLLPAELSAYRAVVFDPPRAGAAAQAAALAASAVPVVVAVSCNPATFARDARVLGEGGFRLRDVLAVDQFLWSAHIELVAVLRR